MSQTHALLPILMNSLYLTPVLLAYVAGIILAVARWQRHPTVSMLVLIACLLGLVVTPLPGAIQVWLVQSQSAQGMAQLSWVFSLIGILSSLVHALIYGLLLAAAFQGRASRFLEPAAPPRI